MNISYYTAVSAMNAFQKDLDVTSNNMANISTNGYKSMRSSFNDLLYTQMDMRPQAQVGHGVRNDGPGTTFQQGIFRKTDRELDFAISGNAFFAIQTSEDEEEPAYTRDGAFQISSTDDGNYLTTSDGSYVLDQDGEPIELGYKTSEDGGDNDAGELDLDGLAERIGLFVCENPEGLQHVGMNLFRTGETSGEWLSMDDLDDEQEKSKAMSHALEMSNCNMSTEMVNLMQTQRAFQLNSRIVTTADQMEEMINNLR